MRLELKEATSPALISDAVFKTIASWQVVDRGKVRLLAPRGGCWLESSNQQKCNENTHTHKHTHTRHPKILHKPKRYVPFHAWTSLLPPTNLSITHVVYSTNQTQKFTRSLFSKAFHTSTRLHKSLFIMNHQTPTIASARRTVGQHYPACTPTTSSSRTSGDGSGSGDGGNRRKMSSASPTSTVIPQLSFWDSTEFGDFNTWCSTHEDGEEEDDVEGGDGSDLLEETILNSPTSSSPVSVNVRVSSSRSTPRKIKKKKKKKAIEPPICLQSLQQSSSSPPAPASETIEETTPAEKDARAERRRQRRLNKATIYGSRNAMDGGMPSPSTRVIPKRNLSGASSTVSSSSSSASVIKTAASILGVPMPNKQPKKTLKKSTTPPSGGKSILPRNHKSLPGLFFTRSSNGLKGLPITNTSPRDHIDLPRIAPTSLLRNQEFLLNDVVDDSGATTTTTTPKSSIKSSSSPGRRLPTRDRSVTKSSQKMRHNSTPSKLVKKADDLSAPLSVGGGGGGGHRPGLFKTPSLRSLSLTKKERHPKEDVAGGGVEVGRQAVAHPPFASPPTTKKVTAAPPSRRSLLMKSLSFRGRSSTSTTSTEGDNASSVSPQAPHKTPTTTIGSNPAAPPNSRRSLLGRSQSLRAFGSKSWSTEKVVTPQSPPLLSPSSTTGKKESIVRSKAGKQPQVSRCPTTSTTNVYETPIRVKRTLGPQYSSPTHCSPSIAAASPAASRAARLRRRRAMLELESLQHEGKVSPSKSPGLDRWSSHDKWKKSPSPKSSPSVMDPKRKLLLERNLMERTESMSKLMRQSSSISLVSSQENNGESNKPSSTKSITAKKASVGSKNDESNSTTIVNIADLFPDAGWGWTSTTPVMEQTDDVIITTCVRDDLSSRKSSEDDDCELFLDDDDDQEESFHGEDPITKPSSDRAAAMYLMSSTCK